MNEIKKSKWSEDWLSVFIGIVVVFLSLFNIFNIDFLGWATEPDIWTDYTKAFHSASPNYSYLSTPISILLTYIFTASIFSLFIRLVQPDLKKFLISYTFIFIASYFCWFLGHYAYIAATKDKLATYNIPWSLSLTGEAGYIFALVFGLIISNFLPKFADKVKEAAKPELFIKSAIVIMGATLAVKSAESFQLASIVIIRGAAAILVAYLIFWSLVYWVARRYFGFSREWAVPLAAGVSICGVSAAIATGAAVRSRPTVVIMVSSLVVIFAVIEMLLLPFLAQQFMWNEPLVAGAWMGLAVKTDGGAISSGAITDALIRAKKLEMDGVTYAEGWITMATSTVKMFIDMFIGIWALILAYIWSTKIDATNKKMSFNDVWQRFPKFVLGYILVFLIVLLIFLSSQTDGVLSNNLRLANTESNVFRGLFFVMTFFSIGLITNFKKLVDEGLTKLIMVYVVSLFGFIIWIGLAIAWLFFNGIKPPMGNL